MSYTLILRVCSVKYIIDTFSSVDNILCELLMSNDSTDKSLLMLKVYVVLLESHDINTINNNVVKNIIVFFNILKTSSIVILNYIIFIKTKN